MESSVLWSRSGKSACSDAGGGGADPYLVQGHGPGPALHTRHVAHVFHAPVQPREVGVATPHGFDSDAGEVERELVDVAEREEF